MRLQRSALGLLLPLLCSQVVAITSQQSRDAQKPIQIGLREILGDHPSTAGVLKQSDRSIGFVAFGDSYSAGIGTGGTLANGTENTCYQGLGAWPLHLAADLADDYGPDPIDLQWLACTGSTTDDLLAGAKYSQIDELNLSLPVDFATLTVGGNDVGFFDVINACIFRFYSFYSGTCEQALLRADAHIRSNEFELKLSIVLMEILDKVHWERKPDFTVTIVGYAQFFNAVTTECDERSLGVWYGGPLMTRDIRQRTNDLVLALNEKLKRTVNAVNSRFARPKARFVDIDAAFEGHRFCESGVLEPDYGRLDTWFFLVGGPDNVRNESQWQNSTSYMAVESHHRTRSLAADSTLIDPEHCSESAEQTKDWGQLALCYMATAKSRDPTLQPAYNQVTQGKNGNWWVPTYYGQVFHPRTRGHEAIKKRLYEVWQ